MKKIFFLILILFVNKIAFADQLAWITKEQAEKTVAYLKRSHVSEMVLWCACCDNDQKTKIHLTGVSYRKVESYDYYEVVITGTRADGSAVSESVDLAYVHLEVNGLWKCLGAIMHFDCDPCTQPFKLH